MLTPSVEMIQLLSTFAAGMTAPTFKNAQVLIYGAILAPGRRTVASALRAVGLSQVANFSKYHRVFNRAKWSGLVMSRRLLLLLVAQLVPAGARVELLVDETLDRRQGPQITYKSWFRDAVRSTQKHVALSLGIRWLCFCLLVEVPWGKRKWALPFLAVPVLSEKACVRLKKKHRSSVEWTRCLMRKIRTWLPDRELVLAGDGGFAAVELAQTCQKLKVPVVLVARLRLDARLFNFPGEQPPGKPGPKPKKGKRLPKLKQQWADPSTPWESRLVEWYGGVQKTLDLVTAIVLWHTPGQDPVPIRVVLVCCPQDPHCEPAAFLCTDVNMGAEQILGWCIGRWNIEVTFEEVRACLGLETQRHWCLKAIGRVTPCLLGLFSLVVVMAKVLHPHHLPLQPCSWYEKPEATFSDALAAVRAHLWSCFTPSHLLNRGPRLSLPVSDFPAPAGLPTEFNSFLESHDLCLIPRTLLHSLFNTLCYTL